MGVAFNRMHRNRMLRNDSPAAVRRPWGTERPVGAVLWFRRFQLRYDHVARTNELVDPPSGPDRRGPARPGHVQRFGRVTVDIWW
jgi:hypothetical protein